MIKKIIIAGGNGFLGEAFIKYLNQNHKTDVYVLTRSRLVNHGNVHYIQWDGESLGDWVNYLEKADVVLNLAGRTVNCRYNEKNRNEIYDSRIKSTYVLGEALKKCLIPPKVWLNMSTATIYQDEYEKFNTEIKGTIGEGFSVDVANKWEETFFSIPLYATRKIALRTAIAFGKEGDVFKIYKNHVKMFLSGHHGHGRQMVSWIHEEDFFRAIMFLIENKEMEGVFNLSSPHAIKDKQMMKTFRKAMGYHFGLPIPAWMIKIGAIFLGTESELILKSRWVYPEKLLGLGFKFKFERMEDALKEIIMRDNSPDLSKSSVAKLQSEFS